MFIPVVGLSRMGLPRLAVLVLSGMFFLSLSDDPSPAQTPGSLAPRSAPGRVVEAIAPAATVVRTAHYQAELGLSCTDFSCSGDFPSPGAKRRLNVTRMSCLLVGSNGSTFSYGRIILRRADNSPVLQQVLPVDHSASNGVHTLNRAVDVQVGAAQHIQVGLSLASGNAFSVACTASGTLDTLQ